MIRKKIFSAVLATLAIVCSITAQKLNIPDVLNYLEQIINSEIQTPENNIEGKREVNLKIHDGILNVKYCWIGNPDVSFNEDEKACNEIGIDISSIDDFSKTNNKTRNIQLSCQGQGKECVKLIKNDILSYYSKRFCDNPEAINHYDYINLFYFNSIETQDVVYNGLIYCIYELLSNENDRLLQTPFSTSSIEKSVVLNRSESINLGNSGGVSTLHVSFAGLEKLVILDSGAADVSIPENVETQLIEKGIINKDNYLPNGFYQVADGRTITARRFIIPFLEIGELTIKNVQCSVNESDDIILLGKTCLNRFLSWSINNETNQLILNY